MAAITALTAQNTQGVSGVELVPPAFVKAQIIAVFEDIRVDAVKIGMIATAEIAYAVAEVLADHPDTPIVLDPVMVAKGGASLLAEDAMEALRTSLLPLATIVTPNLPEAARLTGTKEATDRTMMAAQGAALVTLGAGSALVKGGHLDRTDSPDVLVADGKDYWLDAPRTATKNTHGTGCTLSAALAAHLAQGKSPQNAAQAAKNYVATAIGAADELAVGHGHGPVHHFHSLWRN